MMKRLRIVKIPGNISLRKRRHRQDLVTTFVCFVLEDDFNLLASLREGKKPSGISYGKEN